MNMKKIILFALMLLSSGFVGCAIQEGDTLKTKEVAPSQKNQYQNISPADAKKKLESEKNIILLDVRTVEEHTEKHIPGSMLIPVDIIEKEAESKIKDKSAPIFVYCRSGRRSITASEALIKLGYTNVYNLGGINDWPYETEAGAPK